MEERKAVKVTINGQSHGFISDDEALVLELAEYVNSKMAEIGESPSGKILSNDKKYVLAAMNMAEDYFRQKAKYEELLEESEKKSAESVSNNELIELEKENLELSEKLKAAEYELKYVQQLYEEQKHEYEQLLETVTSPDSNKQ